MSPCTRASRSAAAAAAGVHVRARPRSFAVVEAAPPPPRRPFLSLPYRGRISLSRHLVFVGERHHGTPMPLYVGVLVFWPRQQRRYWRCVARGGVRLHPLSRITPPASPAPKIHSNVLQASHSGEAGNDLGHRSRWLALALLVLEVEGLEGGCWPLVSGGEGGGGG